MKTIIFNIFFLLTFLTLNAQDGHQLWLRDKKAIAVDIICKQNSPTLTIARRELQDDWQGAPGATISLIIKKDKAVKDDGFKLSENLIQANTDKGILYGVYELLRNQQTGEKIQDGIDNPSYEFRILDHWDNPDGSVERGYAGNSIFWRKQNPFIVTEANKKLWQEYARANASIGINGSV